jgi:hypothetical protein
MGEKDLVAAHRAHQHRKVSKEDIEAVLHAFFKTMVCELSPREYGEPPADAGHKHIAVTFNSVVIQ